MSPSDRVLPLLDPSFELVKGHTVPDDDVSRSSSVSSSASAVTVTTRRLEGFAAELYIAVRGADTDAGTILGNRF